MNILLIMAHPRKGSFSEALANSYYQGALEAAQSIRRLELCLLDFEKNVLKHSPRQQKMEACIEEAQKSIKWADHLVFVYPTWWGTYPALLKAFLDRVLTEGFAFEEVEGGTGFRKLLRNKSAEVFTTMDTPAFIYKYLYKSPGHRAIGTATLNFCGVSPVRFTTYGPIRASTKRKRREWLSKTKKAGLEFKGNKYPKILFARQLKSWLKAIRLHFYPLSSLGFLLGTTLASSIGAKFNFTVFILGLLWIFFLEVSTVLINEKEDYETDRQNEFYGSFSGGSRVIVDGLLSFQHISKGIILSISLSILFAIFILLASPSPTINVLTIITLSSILSIGYTLPPLKLSYRGFGALDVSLVHSAGIVLAGFVFQGGDWHNPLPWLLCIPLFFAILPSIILAEIPDKEADKAVGKNTISVRFGRKAAAKTALLASILCLCSTLIIYHINNISKIYTPLIIFALLHAVFLIFQLIKYIKKTSPPKRIDKLIIISLLFVLWFILLPTLSIFIE